MTTPPRDPPTGDTPRSPAPRTGVRHHLAGLVLKLGGWTPLGDPPALTKYVIVGAPHTSTWDGLWMVAFAWWWGLRIRWLLKDSLASGRFGWFFRSVGAVSVDRSSAHGLVGALARAIEASDEMVLSLSPEGTRTRQPTWKSGFYYIALEAKIPICLSYLDYGRKRAGFGPCFHPTGDVKADMDLVRAFYRDVRGRRPDWFTPPKLHEEDG